MTDLQKTQQLFCILQSSLLTFLLMSIANSILLLRNLFISHPLPKEQPLK